MPEPWPVIVVALLLGPWLGVLAYQRDKARDELWSAKVERDSYKAIADALSKMLGEQADRG